MTGVEVGELEGLAPGDLALLLVEVEEVRELEELRAAHVGRGASECLGGDEQEADNY